MRLVEGTDLRALIAAEGRGRSAARRRASSARWAPPWTPPTRAGLVHRDVKPANVLLARADHVYLSDFGLAKSASEAGGLTRQGSIVARAEYVAPEQILEDRVDALTDVYALGCLLFEALTGQAPFATSQGGARDDGPRRGPAPLAPRAAAGPAPPVRRRGAAGDGEGPGASATPRRATSGRPRSWPPGGSAAPARSRSIATGDALPAALRHARPAAAPPGGRRRPAAGAPAPAAEQAGGAAERQAAPAGALRWVLPLAVLVILAVGMVLALGALSKL